MELRTEPRKVLQEEVVSLVWFSRVLGFVLLGGNYEV